MSLIGVLGLFGSICTVCSCYQPRHHPASVWMVTFPFQLLSYIDNRGDSQERNEWFGFPFIQRTLRLSLIPDGYQQLPRAGHMNTALQCTTGGSFALDYMGAWVQKKHRVSVTKKCCLLVWTLEVFLEKQRFAYIKVAHKNPPIILNMKICQELHAKWICIHQSCT